MLLVGIGVNTSLFTTWNALLFRRWNVADAERVFAYRALRIGRGDETDRFYRP